MLSHTIEAKKLYKSSKWLKCRKAYIQSVFGMCERCSQPGLICHHKIHIDSTNVHDPNITLNHNNLEYLCQSCHNKEHFGKAEVIREGLRFNSHGELIEDNNN